MPIMAFDRNGKFLRGLAAAGSGLFAAATTAFRITASGLERFVANVNARGNWVLPRLGSSAALTGIGQGSHGGTTPSCCAAATCIDGGSFDSAQDQWSIRLRHTQFE
jgi:hypothetical protein